MKLVRGAWKILVGIKDALVLIFMLLFFSALFMALSAKPNAAAIRDGALLIALDGSLAEQPDDPDPFNFGNAGEVRRQHRLRDVLHALDVAKDDSRVKAVVLDLDRFVGGYPGAVSEVADAVARVRAAKKPVLAYATAYSDDSYQIAAAASEVWVNPMGGSLFAGPGGSRLYYKGLLDKLGVTAHVYRVGTYKSAVEPYTRADMSPEARAAEQALYDSIFGQWRESIQRNRPGARIADFLTRPDEVVAAAGGDIAKANLSYGLVDKVGDRVAFGKRVAEIAGQGARKTAGSFRAIRLADWIEANPVRSSGDAIGVITVAGEIVDGKADSGSAGGDTVSRLLLDGLARHELKALVVRVDSPGGSAMASEQIRQAILQAKAKGIPVVVSMGSMAASGGYWVSTAGDVIFAQPNTITGSIGIFGVLPTFENTLAKIGVTTDGIQTTPLSGQPDLMGGTNAAVDRVLQSAIEHGYRQFVGLVSAARKLPPARVDAIAQGRVWIGGTAHQLRLVDRLGGFDDAFAEAARRAKIDPAEARAVYLEREPNPWLRTLAALTGGDDEEGEDGFVDDPAGADMFARVAQDRRALAAQALADARRLATGASMQARCLECAAMGPAQVSAKDLSLLDAVLARLGW